MKIKQCDPLLGFKIKACVPSNGLVTGSPNLLVFETFAGAALLHQKLRELLLNASPCPPHAVSRETGYRSRLLIFICGVTSSSDQWHDPRPWLTMCCTLRE